MKKQSALVLVLILLGTIFSPIVLITPPALADWIIDGNKVYFQDDNVYLSASPHTLSEPGWVTFELETSTYSGMIDVGWGFDTPETTPHTPKIWRNYSHTFEGNRIVDEIGNKVLNDVTEWDNLGIENYSQYQVNFGNENNTYLFRFWYNGGVNESIAAFTSYQEIGNGDDYRVTGHYDKSEHYYWQESFYDWDDWDAEFETIEYEHGGMNKWWMLQDVEIEAGKRYMVKAWIQYPLNQNETGKYWWVLKPSDKTIQEAIATDTFYVLDPWYDTDFNYRKKLTIANAYNSYPICINVSKNVGAEVNCSNHCNDNFSDIRFVELDNVTVLDHWIEKFVSGSYAWFWVELADDCTTNNTFWMYYGKASAVNISNGTNTFHWFDDYITDTTGTFTEHDTANTKQWSKNISTIGYNWKRVYSMNWSVSKTGSADLTGIGPYFTKTIWPDDNYFVSHFHYVDSNAAPASSTNASIPIRIYNRNAGTTSYTYHTRTPFHTYYMTFQQKFNSTLSNVTIYNQTFINDTNWYWGQTQSGAIAATQLIEGNITWLSSDRNGFSEMVWKTDRIEITNSYNNQNLQRLSIDWEFVDKWNETEPIISLIGAEESVTPPNNAPQLAAFEPGQSNLSVNPEPNLEVWVNDSDGDTMDIYWYSHIGGVYTLLGSHIGVANGTYSIAGTVFNQYAQTYDYYVNISDGIGWANSSYPIRFYTWDNHPYIYNNISGGSPILHDPVTYPDWADIGVIINGTFRVNTWDAQSDLDTIIFYSNSTGVWTEVFNYTTVNNPSSHNAPDAFYTLNSELLDNSLKGTWYWWRIRAIDTGGNMTNLTLKYKTERDFGGWYNIFYDNYMEFTVSGDYAEGNVSYLPIRVELNSSIRETMENNLTGLVFSDGVCGGEIYPHEVESFNNDGATIWVLVNLTNNTDTNFFMFWSDNYNYNSADNESVWNYSSSGRRFDSVYHMRDQSSTIVVDSINWSEWNVDGHKKGNEEPEEQRWGNGTDYLQNFDGIDDYILTDEPFDTMSYPLAVEIMVVPINLTGTHVIWGLIDWHAAPVGNDVHAVGIVDGNYSVKDRTHTWNDTGVAYDGGTDVIVWRWGSYFSRLYLNGKEIWRGGISGGMGNLPEDAGFMLGAMNNRTGGAHAVSGEYFFDGYIYEFRAFNNWGFTDSMTDWINMSYHSYTLQGHFIKQGPARSFLTYNLFNYTRVNNTFYFNLKICPDGIDFVNWDFGDGHYDIRHNPTHTYMAYARFLLYCEVENSTTGIKKTQAAYISVRPPAEEFGTNILFDLDWTLFFSIIVILIIIMLVVVVTTLAKRSGGQK